MNPDRWKRVQEVFLASLDKESALTDDYLAEVCSGDPSLIEEVKSLLAAHRKISTRFLGHGGKAAQEETGGEDERTKDLLAEHSALSGKIQEYFPAFALLEDFRRTAKSKQGDSAFPERIGEYRLLREIGRGGMGIVYEAVQESLGRRVALKLLPFQSLLHPTLTERFQMEAQLAGRLHHTHIVSVFGTGEHEGIHYYAMQFIDGVGLDRVLEVVKVLRNRASPGDAEGPIEGDALTIGRKLAYPASSTPSSGSSSGGSAHGYYGEVARLILHVGDGLAYAHDHGILHRDIKPSNLLLDRQGMIWVTDFGLAKTEGSDSLTGAGELVGTLRYVAPERFDGEATAQSDIYSLGLTLYELLTLRPAFEETNKSRLVRRIIEEDPKSPCSIDRRIPRDLEAIVRKAIEKEPTVRYASAVELAEDLRRFLLGLPPKAQKVTASGRLWRWCRRKPALAASLFVAAIALLTVAGLSIAFGVTKAQQALDLKAQRDRAEEFRQRAERISANLSLEKGIQLCRQRDAGRGILRLAASLAMAPTDERGVRGAILRNIAAWSSDVNVLRAQIVDAGSVHALAFSPSGEILATAGSDHTLRFWDVPSGSAHGVPVDHLSAINCIAFSPDGSTLATGTQDGKLRLIDVETCSLRRETGDHAGSIHGITYSADGRIFATGSADRTVRLRDGKSGAPLGAPLPHTGDVKSVAFSADGKVLAAGCNDATVAIWDTSTGTPIREALRHTGAVQWTAFGPDGKTLLTAGSRNVIVWNLPAGTVLEGPLEHEFELEAARLSPDGKTILTADGLTAFLWKAGAHGPAAFRFRLRARMACAALSADGKMALTGSAASDARLWDVATGEPIGSTLEHGGALVALAFSPDGRTAATSAIDGPGSTVRLWSLASRPKRSLLPNANRFVASDPRGRFVLTGSDNLALQLWKLPTLEPARPPVQCSSAPMSGSFSPDGETILIGHVDGKAQLWLTETLEPIGPALEHGGQVRAAGFHPGGDYLLTGGLEGSVKLWVASTGDVLKTLQHANAVEAAVFRADGKYILTGCWDNAAHLWDANTGERLRAFPHRSAVRSVSFSPDGALALTGSFDHTARVWDVESGAPLGAPMEAEDSIMGVAFGGDGRTVFTGCFDGTASFWDAPTGKPIGPPFRCTRPIYEVGFDTTGRRAFFETGDESSSMLETPPDVADDERRVRLWTETLTGLSLEEDDSLRVLPAAEWQARVRALESLGGPPALIPAGKARTDGDASQGTVTESESLFEMLKKAQKKHEAAGRRDIAFLASLASLQFRAGQVANAITTLEEALPLQVAGPTLSRRLEAYRLAHLPSLASFASVDWALERPVALIPVADEWRFFRGKREPSPGLQWTELDFDDSDSTGWEAGKSGFGYGDGGEGTELRDMRNSYTTVYFRRGFKVPDAGRFGRFVLSFAVDDGAIVYLNGREVCRVRAGNAGERLPFDGTATDSSPEPPAVQELFLGGELLNGGTNVLAIQGLNHSRDSSDFALVPVLQGLPLPGGKLDRERFDEYRRAAEMSVGKAAAPDLLAYFEARVLQREGRQEEAADGLRRVLDKRPESTEANLHLAESIRAAGKPNVALDVLHTALTQMSGTRALWDAWLEIAFMDMRLGPGEALSRLPRRALEDDRGPGKDLVWTLTKLAEEKAIRINCGGEDFTGEDNRRWSGDRFFVGGGLYDFGRTQCTRDIAGTNDDPLYQTERWFLPDTREPPGYRIPLPPGRYRVVLHFAEIWFTQRSSPQRVFDVLAEGKPVITKLDLLQAVGYATAHRVGFDVNVFDGLLDIDFRQEINYPKVSAIEVTPADAR